MGAEPSEREDINAIDMERMVDHARRRHAMRQDVRDSIGCASIFVILILLVFAVMLEMAFIQNCQERHPGASWRACLIER